MLDHSAAGTGDRGRRRSAGAEPPVTGRAPGASTGVERAAYLLLLAFAGAPLFSIFAAELLLAVISVLWLFLVIRGRERIAVPPMFWPLLAYAGATLVS